MACPIEHTVLDFVYVKLAREHCKEDTTWKCNSASEALNLTKWLNRLGLNAQRIDQEVFNAMPNCIPNSRF